MYSIYNLVMRWLLQHLISLALIVAVLIAGNFIHKEYLNYKVFEDEIRSLDYAEQSINNYRYTTETEVTRRVAKTKSATQYLNLQINLINEEIKLKKRVQQKTGDLIVLLTKFPGINGVLENRKLEVEIVLLVQARDYLIQLRAYIDGKNQSDTLQKAFTFASEQLIKSEQAQKRLIILHPIAVKNPTYYEFWTLRKLEKAHEILTNKKQTAWENLEKMQKNPPVKTGLFVIDKAIVDLALEPLYRKIKEDRTRVSNNLFITLSKEVSEVIVMAVWILLLAILIPILIKAAFYFILAPLASRRPAICILPNEAGLLANIKLNYENEQGPTKISAVSIQLNINKNQELLMHPEYIQSSSIAGKKDTKWFLSNALPISSLLSGMVALTRIRTDESESVVISATQDALSEVGFFTIQAGSAFVIQPRSLIGVLQQKDTPMQITRHWRLLSLHAWLTLQLRYLVFHGPVTLVVKGCRGVRVERAGTGRRVSQAATIGFSANLQYSTTRCETFFPYLTSKQELLFDGFVGEYGYYIYEEMPYYGKSKGLTSRGLEGFTDSILKVMGI